jgi:hypothetical protein
MNPLEEKLRHALRREDPPPGFTERVLAKIPDRPREWRETIRSYFRAPLLRWAVAGAFTFSLVIGGVLEHQRRQRLRAEEAMAGMQVMQALRIASAELNTARRKVSAIGQRRTPATDQAGREDTTDKN